MKHPHAFLKVRAFGLAAVFSATALGACASTSEAPAKTEAAVTNSGSDLVTEAPAPSGPVSAASGTLILNVTGYKAQSGQIMVALYNDETAFDSEGAPFRAAKVTVEAAQTVITFNDLPGGEYGFKVYHDENGNGELDTNAFGIPSERYAFSMDASDPFSAPEWVESKFSLSSGENIRNVSLD